MPGGHSDETIEWMAGFCLPAGRETLSMMGTSDGPHRSMRQSFLVVALGLGFGFGVVAGVAAQNLPEA